MARTLRWKLLTACAFLVAIAILSPQLVSGYVGDDVHNSLSVRHAYGEGGILGDSVLERAVGDAKSWIDKGRLYPLATYALPLYYALDGNLLAYKLFILVLTLVNLWQFHVLVKRITSSDALAVLAIIAVPLFLQMRTNDDPLISYHALVQVTTMFTLASLLTFARYLNGGPRWNLALSVLTYLCALLTYEISLPFFLFHVVLARFYPQKRPARRIVSTTWPLAGSAFAIAALTVVLRLGVGKPMAGGSAGMTYVPNFEPGLVLLTLAKQLSAALPLTFAAGSVVMKTEYVEVLSRMLVPSLLVGLPVAVITFGVVLAAFRDDRMRTAGGQTSPTALLVTLGLAVLVLPDVLTSLSPVYQDAMQWGLGHLGAYVSCYGSALLCLGGASALQTAPARKAWILVAVAVMASGVAGMNYVSNRTTIELVNQRWKYPSEVVRRSLNAGILEDVPEGATLFLPDGRFWDTSEYYSLFGKTDLDVVVGWSELERVLPVPQLFVLDYSVPVTRGGWVTLGRAPGSVESTSDMAIQPLLEYREPAEGPVAAGELKRPLWTLQAPPLDGGVLTSATGRRNVRARPTPVAR